MSVQITIQTKEDFKQLFQNKKFNEYCKIGKYTRQWKSTNYECLFNLFQLGFSNANLDKYELIDILFKYYTNKSKIQEDEKSLIPTPITIKNVYDFMWNFGEFELRWLMRGFMPNKQVHYRCEAAIEAMVNYFKNNDVKYLNLEHTESWFDL